MQTVSGNVRVYVWPTREWELKEGESMESTPFQTRLMVGACYEENAVLVHEESITVTVPDSVDMREAMITTITKARQDLIENTQRQLAALNSRLQQLMMLEHIA